MSNETRRSAASAYISSPGSFYERLGGEPALRRIVTEFYDIVEAEAEGAALLRLHRLGHGVEHSRSEQLAFLSGFLGGPSLYAAHHGHSDVRKIHEHVAVDVEAKDAWLRCMTIALGRAGIEEELQFELLGKFRRVATMLVNS